MVVMDYGSEILLRDYAWNLISSKSVPTSRYQFTRAALASIFASFDTRLEHKTLKVSR